MTNIKQKAREMLQNINSILERIKLNEWKKECICMQKSEVHDATTQSWAITGQKYCDELQVKIDQIIDMAIAEEREKVVNAVKHYFNNRQKDPKMHEYIFWSDVSNDIVDLINDIIKQSNE